MNPAALLLAANLLVNPGFLDDAKGWTRATGATTGNANIASEISIVASGVFPAGSAVEGSAVQFFGQASTCRWPMLTQRFPVEPGQRIAFRVAGRCWNLRKEANQYANANALLIIQSKTGERLLFRTSAVLSGNCERTRLRVTAIAPVNAAMVTVGVFASMSGTAWFDAPHLAIASATAETRESRELAFDVLRGHLEQTYPFFGLNGRPDHAWKLTPDPDSDQFMVELRGLLGRLRDPHVWFTYRGMQVSTGPQNEHTPDWNLSAILKKLDPVTMQRRNRIFGRIGDVGYAGIGSFVAGDFEGVLDALDRFADCRALILDVRFNSGGDEKLAQQLAARFATRDVVYARQVGRDPIRPGKFRPLGERRIGPVPGRKPDTRPVIVLQGRHCMSSCEGFLLMVRAIEGMRSLGMPSRGASANPKPFPLLENVTVWSSTWRSLTPAGDCIEDVGVEPEIAFDAPPGSHAKSDPTLDQALALLSK